MDPKQSVDGTNAQNNDKKEELSIKADFNEVNTNEETDDTQSTSGSLVTTQISSSSDHMKFWDKERTAAFQASIKNMDLSQRKEFMLAPLPAGVWLECYLLRVSVGFSKLSRKFELYLADGTFLAVCEKQGQNKGAHYVVSTDPTNAERRDNPYCVGKIRSNFVGSQFTAFGAEGLNPKKIKDKDGDGLLGGSGSVREELMHLSYQHAFSSLKPSKRRRKIDVTMPHVTEDMERVDFFPKSPSDGLKAYSGLERLDGLPIVNRYVTVKPTYVPERKKYCLNFGSRVKERSVRNLQLKGTQDGESKVFLQFGREAANKFILDFGSPYCPFQAFTLATSAMDYKICTQ